MARAFIFGNIQMSNITDIYSTGKINGVTGVGKQDSSSVNGTPAYTGITTIQAQQDPSNRNICTSSTSPISVSNGTISGSTYIFVNESGFSQPQNRFYKDANSNPFYVIDGTRDGSDLYALTYQADC
jgi:hypothetical protein